MAQLILFEWKKIFGRRTNKIAMLIGVVITAIVTRNYIFQNAVFDPDTREWVEGIQSFELAKEVSARMTDVLTEEFISEEIEKLKSYGVDLGSEQAYSDILRPYRDFWNLVIDNYAEMNSYEDYDFLNNITAEDGSHFYEVRKEKLRSYLDKEFSYGNYTQAEKDFWIGKSDEVTIPFQWGNKDNMWVVWESVAIGGYNIFIIILCVTPMFCSEFESGAAALLLTTKRGRRTHAVSKIIAALSFALLYQCVIVGAAIAATGLLIGFDGADLPVQLWGTDIPYNWSVGKAVFINILIVMLVTVAMVLFTLVLSARIRNGIAVLAVSLTVIIAPTMFPMSKTSGLWNHINYLFPVRAIILEDCIKVFNSYAFGNVVFSYVEMIFLVYAAVSVLCLCFIGGGYTKYQVK